MSQNCLKMAKEQAKLASVYTSVDQDLTGKVIFIGDPGVQEDGRPGFYTAQLI